MTEITYSIIEVATGLYQLKMPLPFRLNHINLYLIEDTDGWVLVDTGLNTEKTRELWVLFLNSGFFEKPIKKILMTHLHPDHIGMSAWLSRTLNVPVFISKGEWEMAQFLWKNESDTAKSLYEDYWQSFGLQGTSLDEMVSHRMHYKKLVGELPDSVSYLHANSIWTIKGREWHMLPAPGHSPEHICLWNPSQRILISGDHVLPTITPNISYHPIGLENPLESYINSLESFLKLDCEYYFPAHGPISPDLHQRIAEIIQHHRDKLAILMNSIQENITVVEAMPLLFSKDLPSHQLMFAYAETAAHLLYLAGRKLLHIEDKKILSFANYLKQKENFIENFVVPINQ